MEDVVAQDDRRKYNLTPEDAIVELKTQLATMRTHNRGELDGMDPDTAFEKGYEMAIFDYEHYTGPDPRVRAVR